MNGKREKKKKRGAYFSGHEMMERGRMAHFKR